MIKLTQNKGVQNLRKQTPKLTIACINRYNDGSIICARQACKTMNTTFTKNRVFTDQPRGNPNMLKSLNVLL